MNIIDEMTVYENNVCLHNHSTNYGLTFGEIMWEYNIEVKSVYRVKNLIDKIRNNKRK